jgi:hypothetical protein
MRLDITAAQLNANPAVQSILFSKLLAQTEWSTEDLTHSQLQYCLDNSIGLDRAVLFSPVLTEAQVSAYVPLTWPQSSSTDEDEVVTRVAFKDYMRPILVTGGIVLQFVGSKMDSNRNITLPTDGQLRAQVALAGGFLTGSEVEAIRIVEESL